MQNKLPTLLPYFDETNVVHSRFMEVLRSHSSALQLFSSSTSSSISELSRLSSQSPSSNFIMYSSLFSLFSSYLAQHLADCSSYATLLDNIMCLPHAEDLRRSRALKNSVEQACRDANEGELLMKKVLAVKMKRDQAAKFREEVAVENGLRQLHRPPQLHLPHKSSKATKKKKKKKGEEGGEEEVEKMEKEYDASVEEYNTKGMKIVRENVTICYKTYRRRL